MKKLKLLVFTFLIALTCVVGVKAEIYEFTCNYTKHLNNDMETFVVGFRINGDNVEMTSCKYERAFKTTFNFDCSDYKFDNNGHYSTNGKSCPSSVDVNQQTKVVKWIMDSKGSYLHTSGSKKNYTGKSTCLDFTTKQNECEHDKDVACVWVENPAAPHGGYCNVDNLLYVRCGDATDIPMQAPQILSFVVNLLKIATPIILIFTSVISLVKTLAAQKEDEIKKVESILVRRVIAAVLVFFTISIVQFVISKVARDNDELTSFSNCLNCFLNNRCENTTYYKTVIDGEDWCTPLTTRKSDLCCKFLNSGVKGSCNDK